MKRLVIIYLCFATLAIISCKESRQFPKEKSINESTTTDFVATLENKLDQNKNCIYSASLLLAWDQIKNELGPTIKTKQADSDLFLLNNSKSYKGVLEKDEYSASAKIEGDRIIAKAQFAKSLPFAERLKSYKNSLLFSDTKVASFGANGHDYFKFDIIDILYYQNDSNFIIRLNPKDKEHEILLFMSSKSYGNLGEYYAALTNLLKEGKQDHKDYKSRWRCIFMEDDQLIVPKFSFNLSKDYNSMVGDSFDTKKGLYKIDEAWQRTAFILDEAGAEIDSEAWVEVSEAMEDEDPPKPKKLIFNKPFCVFLARKNVENPYFGMWVANAELMVKE